MVQDLVLADELEALRGLTEDLARVEGECDALAEELPSEEDDAPESELTEDEAAEKQEKLAALQKRQKALKKSVKEAEGALELATAEAMKGLSDAQVHELLERKWIDPLVEALEALPRKAVDELVAKIGGLKDKYGDTYADVAQQISETERELDEMLGQLVGNDFDMLGIAELRNLLGGGRHD